MDKSPRTERAPEPKVGTMGVRRACVSALLSLLVALSVARGERAAPTTPEVTVSDSVLENPRAYWRISGLRREVRRRIHLTSSKVPRFPHEDPRLMDPHKWPRVMVIGGEKLPLTIESHDHDFTRPARSMSDVKAGWGYTLRYGKGRGPVYTWAWNGSLAERSWRGGGKLPPETYLNLYYPSGELSRFEYRSHGYYRQTDAPRSAHCLEEVFARTGTLIGFAYRIRCGSDKEQFTGYWLGEEVGQRKFYDLAFQAQSSVNRRFWKPQRR